MQKVTAGAGAGGGGSATPTHLPSLPAGNSKGQLVPLGNAVTLILLGVQYLDGNGNAY